MGIKLWTPKEKNNVPDDLEALRALVESGVTFPPNSPVVFAMLRVCETARVNAVANRCGDGACVNGVDGMHTNGVGAPCSS